MMLRNHARLLARIAGVFYLIITGSATNPRRLTCA